MMIHVYRVYHDDAHNHRTVRAETREEAEVIGAIIFGVPAAEIIVRYVITEARKQ
mgnify:CR=1 FL=1